MVLGWVIVVVVGKVVVVYRHDYAQNEEEEEDKESKVDVGYHLVPTRHLVLKTGGRLVT